MADDLYSSDRDEDLSFASPQTPVPGRAKNPTSSDARFDTDEAREAALRKELEGVRKINEVIEGLIGTLERTKGNMNVRYYIYSIPAYHLQIDVVELTTPTRKPPDCTQHRQQRFHPAQHVDPHPLTNRAQPTTHPQPAMEGRHPRPCRDGGRSPTEAAGS
jgi:hypothetical protein